MAPSRQELFAAANSFCQAFQRKDSPGTILSYFSTTHSTVLIEHGDPALAPFLGRPFQGQAAIRGYFELIGSLLAYEKLDFYEFLIDTESTKVAVKGHGTFTWLSTKQSWEEDIAYLLKFDDTAKLTRLEIWADTGCAYLASVGQLGDVKKGKGVY